MPFSASDFSACLLIVTCVHTLMKCFKAFLHVLQSSVETCNRQAENATTDTVICLTERVCIRYVCRSQYVWEARLLRLWSKIPPHIRNFHSAPAFRKALKTYLFSQAIPPIASHFSIVWSVCRLSPCFNRSTDLDAIWQIHLWGLITPDPRGRRNFGVEPLDKTCNCKLQPNHQSYAATWRIQMKSWLGAIPHLLPNYFGRCYHCNVCCV